MSDTQYEGIPVAPPTINLGNMPGYGQMNETIAAMRWQSDEIVKQLYETLGGYKTTIDHNNNLVASRDTHKKAMINDDGLQRLIAIIKSKVNATTSLTNIDEEQALLCVQDTLLSVNAAIAKEWQNWQITITDAYLIQNTINDIVFSQMMRAVGGHESVNFRTQTFEQNVHQQFQQPQQSGGFSLIPNMFKRRN